MQVVNECKKLNFRIVRELEDLQIIEQQNLKGGTTNNTNTTATTTGWWKGWGKEEENVSDVDAAAKFLIRESQVNFILVCFERLLTCLLQRLYELRDKFVTICNKVASLSESVHQSEKEIFKWRLYVILFAAAKLVLIKFQCFGRYARQGFGGCGKWSMGSYFK